MKYYYIGMRIRGEEMVQVWAQILIFETRPLMLSANVNNF